MQPHWQGAPLPASQPEAAVGGSSYYAVPSSSAQQSLQDAPPGTEQEGVTEQTGGAAGNASAGSISQYPGSPPGSPPAQPHDEYKPMLPVTPAVEESQKESAASTQSQGQGMPPLPGGEEGGSGDTDSQPGSGPGSLTENHRNLQALHPAAGGVVGHHRHGEEQDPGQGGHPA